MKAFFSFLVFCFVLNLSAFGQDLAERENELLLQLNTLRSAKNNKEKEIANKAFKSYLAETIALTGVMDYPFAKLTTLGSIKSADNLVRLFNWNIEQDDESQKYYCYVLHFNESKKEFQVNELVDNSFMLPPQPEETLESKDWYGALYYSILPFEKGSKKSYALIGWDGSSPMSNTKIVDVLYFNGSSAKLGSPVFKVNGETKRRLFFEYSKKSIMHLNYDKEQDRIIMDHLSPETPNMKGMYAFYVPDLSYDALELKNGKWILKEDVIGVNKKGQDKVEVGVYDPKTGEVKTKEVKAKWEDPSNANAPGGGSVHISTTPDQEDGINNPESSEKTKSKKEKRKDRKRPESYNPTGKKGKK